MSAAIRILSPAKINLFLVVLRRRPDGFHDIFSLLCPIGLYDHIQLTFDRAKIEVRCSDDRIPQDDANLAFTAARLLFGRLNIDSGVRIHIDKNIPPGAGLGGGSSNAAGVLVALNRHFGEPLSQRELMRLGQRIGADVPFFVFRQPALASGIGEQLEAYAGLRNFQVLLVNPGFAVSTKEVYEQLNLRLTKCKKKITRSLLKKSGFSAARHLCNDLETVTAAMYPELNAVKNQMMQQGALGALMSGSGPTVFGLFEDSDKARKAKRVFDRKNRWHVYSVEMLTDSNAWLVKT